MARKSVPMEHAVSQCQVQIRSEWGLHLRTAARFAEAASHFRCEVCVRFQDRIANGKSILDLLTLAAGRDARVNLEARGADAEEAIAELARLVASWAEQPEAGPTPLAS